MIALALRDPLWRGALISGDATVGAIVVELASSDSDASRSVLRALEDALAPFEDQGFRYYIVGQTAQFALTDESLAADSQRLTPIMIGLVAAVVFALFRSWQTVLSALAAVGLASVWTMGVQGFLRWPENSITQTVPPLILVVSLCVSIHVLSRYSQRRLASGAVSAEERKAALVEAARDTGLACLATTLTTAVGFLAFAASGLESFVRFGVVSATGIVAALFLSFSILPILMCWFPADRMRAARASETWDHALSAMVMGTRVRARSILVGALLLGGLCIVGAWRLETDVDEYELYGEESEVVKAFRFAEAHLRRPDSLEIELQLPEGRDLHDPATLNAIHGFASELSRIEGLGPVRSVLDALAWTNRLLNDDGPEFERLGRTAQENGALLTLLSLNDPSAPRQVDQPGFPPPPAFGRSREDPDQPAPADPAASGGCAALRARSRMESDADGVVCGLSRHDRGHSTNPALQLRDRGDHRLLHPDALPENVGWLRRRCGWLGCRRDVLDRSPGGRHVRRDGIRRRESRHRDRDGGGHHHRNRRGRHHPPAGRVRQAPQARNGSRGGDRSGRAARWAGRADDFSCADGGLLRADSLVVAEHLELRLPVRRRDPGGARSRPLDLAGQHPRVLRKHETAARALRERIREGPAAVAPPGDVGGRIASGPVRALGGRAGGSRCA